MPSIGVALGGGGTAGLSGAGVLRELCAAGIVPDVVAGTSAGAGVGAAFAAGASVNAAALYEDRQISPARSNTHHPVSANRYFGEDHQSRI